MPEPLPILLIPGLLSSLQYYAPQLPRLWRFGPVTVADHTRDDSMRSLAQRILADAPRRFALVGHSMGGYIAFEVLRQAAARVARLALLDTSARADAPEQTERRQTQIALARGGRFDEVPGLQYPNLVHPARLQDEALRDVVTTMAHDVGADAFVRQQTAIIGRIDSRKGLGSIRVPTLVVVGDCDAMTPPERAHEIADGIAGARLVVVPDCGHMCALERPESVTQALVSWLEQ